MSSFILFLLFFVGIPLLFVYYSMGGSNKFRSFIERLKKPLLPVFSGFLEQYVAKIFSVQLENRRFLKGMIWGWAVGIYAVYLLLLPVVLAIFFVLILGDKSGAGGAVFAEMFIASIVGFPWILMLIEKYPVLINGGNEILLVATVLATVATNATLLGVIKGFVSLFRKNE